MDFRGIRVLHFADAHIGVENYGRVDPATGLHTRLQDFLATLDATVSHAIENDFDLIVFAGDAFKARDPNPTHQREFARRLVRAASAGIPVFLLVGNHDVPNAAGRASSLEIYSALRVPNVVVCARPEVRRLETRRGPVLVAGLPYVPRTRLLARDAYKDLGIEDLNAVLAERVAGMVEELAAQVRAARGEEPDLPAVLTAHLSVADARAGSERSIMLGTEMVVPAGALELPEFDYVALGHLHPYQELGMDRKVVYAGSLDRVDFGEEGEPKGFVVVDLVRGAARHEFIPNRVRPFVTVRARVPAEAADPTAAILEAVAGRDLEGAVVKLVVEMDQKRWPEVRQREILQALEARAHHVLPIHKEWTAVAAALRSPTLTERLDPVAAVEQYFRTCKKPAMDLEGILERARALEETLREMDGAVAP